MYLPPRYTIHSARTIRRRPEHVPEAAGLYALVLDTSSELSGALARADSRLSSLALGTRPVLYLGSTADSLRRRVLQHLKGDSRQSTFRMSLGALLAHDLGLTPCPSWGKRYFDFGAGESTLSRWIETNLSVAYRAAPAPADEERRLIERQGPLLNIRFREHSYVAEALVGLRRACAWDGTGAGPSGPIL